MNTPWLTVLLPILTGIGVLFTLNGLYYLAVALLGFARLRRLPETAPATRFAVVTAARNEEAVVGNLVDSLERQNYPRGLFDIIVVPNNCTDDTRGVALAHGAKVFDPKAPVHSKGEVLTQVVDALLAEGGYDAICVFDADNLAHPDFLARMNDAYQSGVQVASGYRDSKNPDDTAVSTCCSMTYWMQNRFYNKGREKLGLSALVSGCGFMVGLEFLRGQGGWHTCTITEDYEFTAQCVLAGQRVHYVENAVFYDEQPLTFRQSWKQRRRWCTGFIQGMQGYLAPLLAGAVKRRSTACLDTALTFMQPAVQLASLITGALTGALLLWRYMLLFPGHLLLLALLLAGAALGAYLAVSCLGAWLVGSRSREMLDRTGGGIAFFAPYLVSWMLVSLVSMFKRQETWEAIRHTRGVTLQELGRR